MMISLLLNKTTIFCCNKANDKILVFWFGSSVALLVGLQDSKPAGQFLLSDHSAHLKPTQYYLRFFFFSWLAYPHWTGPLVTFQTNGIYFLLRTLAKAQPTHGISSYPSFSLCMSSMFFRACLPRDLPWSSRALVIISSRELQATQAVLLTWHC